MPVACCPSPASCSGVRRPALGLIALRWLLGAGLPPGGRRDDHGLDGNTTDRQARAQILVVEDDASHARLMQALLADTGCEVRCASDANQALALLEEGLVPRLIVMDLQLPGLDGLALARILLQRKELADTSILAVTAYWGEETADQALAAGCSAFVEKPIDADPFHALVAQCLSARGHS